MQELPWKSGLSGLVFLFFLVLGLVYGAPGSVTKAQSNCDKLGWFPQNFGLKDHSVFSFEGYYYIVANMLPSERKFAYARSQDLCEWEELSPVLPVRKPGTWDEMAIWAPYVFEENGTFYMFYTGVTDEFTQSILLAITQTPNNPASWVEQGMVFQPDHDGMVWQAGTWADARDPMVIKVNQTYHLYYSGLDTDGAIIGLATASSLIGSWTDWGAILKVPSSYARLESSFIVSYSGLYYLFYNDHKLGEMFRIGPTPSGPWTEAQDFKPGWAHELWQGERTYTSYLTSYTITINPVTWDTFFDPPIPFIGENVYHIVLPFVQH